MADAMFTMDCNEQFRLLQQHQSQEIMLAPMLEGMCNTLAMGVEEYVRAFDVAAGVTILCELGEKYVVTNGDAATMCFRALALVLEHVPGALQFAATPGGGRGAPASLPKRMAELVATKLKSAFALQYDMYGPGSLCEDGLRVLNFLAEMASEELFLDGKLFIDLLGVMDLADPLTVGRMLDTLQQLCAKIFVPLPEKKITGFGLKKDKDTKTPQRTRGGNGELPMCHGSQALRRALETLVVPRLAALLQMAVDPDAAAAAAALAEEAGIDSSTMASDAWPRVEGAMLSLAHIARRVAYSHFSTIARATSDDGVPPPVPPEMAAAIAGDQIVALCTGRDTIAAILTTLTSIANTDKRRETVFAALTMIAQVNRGALWGPLTQPDTVAYFSELLAASKSDIASMLSNPFRRRNQQQQQGSQSQQQAQSQQLVISGALHLLQTMTLPMPTEHSSVPFRVLPLPVWEWADDMHAFSPYQDDTAAALEAAYQRLQHKVQINCRGSTYIGSLEHMIQSGRGPGRPIRRFNTPKQYVFADYGGAIAHLSQVASPTGCGQGDAGPAVAPTAAQLQNCVVSNKDYVPMLLAYIPILTAFGGVATSEMQRAMSVRAVTQLVSAIVASSVPVSTAQPIGPILQDLVEFCATMMSVADDLVTIDLAVGLLEGLAGFAARVKIPAKPTGGLSGTFGSFSSRTTSGTSPASKPAVAVPAALKTVQSFASLLARFGITKRIELLCERLQKKLSSDGGGDGGSGDGKKRKGPMQQRHAAASGGMRALHLRMDELMTTLNRAASTATSTHVTPQKKPSTAAVSPTPAASAVKAATPSRTGAVKAPPSPNHTPSRGGSTGTTPQRPTSAGGGLSGSGSGSFSRSPGQSQSPASAQDAPGDQLRAALETFTKSTLSFRKAYLPDLMRSVAACESMTSFELSEIDISTPLMEFLLVESAEASPPTMASPSGSSHYGVAKSPSVSPGHGPATPPLSRHGSEVVLPTATSKQRASGLNRLNPKRSAEEKVRFSLFKSALEGTPKALVVLLRVLIDDLSLLVKRQPESPGLFEGTSKPRFWSEAVNRLGEMAVPLKLCSFPDSDHDEDAESAAATADHHDYSPQDLCPEGHPLMRGTTTNWSCDECGESFRGVSSFGCNACDFDICEECHEHWESDSEFVCEVHVDRRGNPIPQQPTGRGANRPRAHLLATAGDIESAFRNGEAFAAAGGGGGGGPGGSGILSQLDDLSALLNAATMSGHGNDRLQGLAEQLRMLQSTQQGGGGGGGGGANGGDASTNASNVPALKDTDVRLRLALPRIGILPLNEPLTASLYRYGTVYRDSKEPLMSVRAIEHALMSNGHHDSSSPGRGGPQGMRRPPGGFGRPGPPGAGGDGFDMPWNASQPLMLHVFESDRNPQCVCGLVNRTSAPAVYSRPQADLMLDPRIQLLSELWNAVVSEDNKPGRVSYVIPHGPFRELGVTSASFECGELGQRLVRSIAANAARVAVLPLKFAIPTWVMDFLSNPVNPFVNRDARVAIASFAANGARRLLWKAIQEEGLGGGGLFSAAPRGRIQPSEWLRHVGNRPATKEKVRRGEHFEEDARRVLLSTAERREPLQFEFEGDKGTGLGPTIQFFTMVAEHLCLRDRGLWRSDNATPGSGAPPSVATAPAKSAAKKSTGSSTATAVPARRGSTDSSHRDPTSLSVASAEGANAYLIPPAEGLYFKPVERQKMSRAQTTQRLKAFELLGLTAARAVCDGRLFPMAASVAVAAHVQSDAATEAAASGGSALLASQCDWEVMQSVKKVAELAGWRGLTPPPPPATPTTSTSTSAVPLASELSTTSLPDDPLSLDANATNTDTAAIAAENAAKAAANIDAMELYFTMPGNDTVALCPGGADKKVSLDNLQDYVQNVAKAIVHDAVADEVAMFRRGWLDILPGGACVALSPMELWEAVAGRGATSGDQSTPLFTREELQSVVIANHGYVRESAQVRWLIDVLCDDFSPREQAAFLHFATGCPRLPMGGITTLGNITVVKKDVEGGGGAGAGQSNTQLQGSFGGGSGTTQEAMRAAAAALAPASPQRSGASSRGLPSVNTCFKYVKLPPYESRAEMAVNLRIAINDSGDGFDLS